MKAQSFSDFENEIFQIKEYLKHIRQVNDVTQFVSSQPILLAQIKIKKFVDHYIKNDRELKLFEYKSIIISLYGLLEKYIELWVQEYLSTLATIIPNYNLVPQRIRDNHFLYSLQLIKLIEEKRRLKYQHLDKEVILKKLSDCINNPAKYILNTEAFTINSGNLKHKKVVELFQSIDIDLNRFLKTNKIFLNFIEQEQGSAISIESDSLFNPIDDLVERRNSISHGSAITDILSKQLLESLIGFLENYCKAIFEILHQQLNRFESVHNYHQILTIRNVWNNEILGFEIENYTIKVGDFLIHSTSKDIYYKKPILEIKINHDSYNKLIVKEKKDVAIRVDKKIKDTHVFFLQNQVVDQDKKVKSLTNNFSKRTLKRLKH